MGPLRQDPLLNVHVLRLIVIIPMLITIHGNLESWQYASIDHIIGK